MFNFTTTTVINDATGVVKILTDAEGKVADRLQIKNVNNFYIDGIKKIYVKKGVDGTPATLTKPSVEEVGTYRLDIYVQSAGNADPLFANSFVTKGKPISIEFAKTSDGDNFDEAVKKLGNYVSGVFTPVFTGEGEDKKIASFTAVNPYIFISKATLSKLVENTKNPSMSTFKVESTPVSFTQGTEGCGTYELILKDLRLPTAANLRWKRTMEDEMPKLDNLYTQITIEYVRDRGVMGLGAVGMLATSKTTHVFFVENTAAETIVEQLGELDLDDDVIENLDA